ncbi:hypothetical protein CYMTET_25941 [Cymbomonas tetramitiformis]|uniref:Cilia- and flagella-associated protein 206 n=1 Tax=Cymbomonas tetramitiformis TaxID=36881 RepID=A0AAE0KYQ8_9CHLO|nr:hypothetical protein CYMTET_25941 [Cymbomonas tetramitiformis]KAK3265370.1 hypothetical protein CYMTET_25941 [Cymbomonas tetramitiformis]
MGDQNELDDNTRRAVGEALRLCRERNKEVSNTVLAFLIRAVAVEEPAKYKLYTTQPSSLLTQVAQVCVDRAVVDNAPSLDTISMEVEVEREYIDQGKTLQQESTEKDDRANSLEFEITSTRHRAEMDDSEFFTSLYRKIFTYVASCAGIEAAFQSQEVEAETMAALESVFPKHGLRRFLSLGREDKAAQLKELTNIVQGIRVFNHSIGKGGLALEDPTGPFQSQANRLGLELQTMAQEVQADLDKYETVISYKSTLLRPSEDLLLRLRDEHNNRLAYLDLAHFLLEQVEKGISTVASLAEQYEDEKAAMQDTVGNKQSVPKEKVYPKLEAIGTLHGLLMQERRMLVVLRRVADVLAQYKSTFTPTITAKDLHEAQSNFKGTPPLLSDVGPAPHLNPKEAAEVQNAERLTWEEACVGEESLPQLRCGGFSSVSAVKRNGLLLRAVPEGGCVRWNGGLYGFVDANEAEAFAANPKEYMSCLDTVVVRMPELVRLLRLEESFPTLRMADIVEVVASPVTCDFGTQTPVHFIEKNIDRNYEWNEWALRRRVLALTNLRQKRTHSQQTELSHYRREQQTQVWLPKTSTTQTAVQKGTSMPQKKMYIQGLRGAPGVRMNVVNVDMDLGQPHEF